MAYLLARDGASVTVVEAAPTAGGLLSTFDVGNGARPHRSSHADLVLAAAGRAGDVRG